jgi:Domain of unknown function (DUF4404)
MPDESLSQLLQRVRARLSEGAALDGESRQQLGSLVQDIERTMGGSAAAPASAAHAPRLESLAVRFEAGHPALAETLRELMDALVKAGI